MGLAGEEESRRGSSGIDSMLLGVGGAVGEGVGELQLTPDSRLMTLSMSSSDARRPLAESSVFWVTEMMCYTVTVLVLLLLVNQSMLYFYVCSHQLSSDPGDIRQQQQQQFKH